MKLRRSTLFIPGSLDEAATIDRIRHCGADVICLDLEDTVAPARKAAARQSIGRLFQLDIWGRAIRAVRINAVGAGADADIAECIAPAAGKVDTLFLSKPNTVADITAIDDYVNAAFATRPEAKRPGYVVGIESARALTDIDQLCRASPQVEALGFAIGDLSASLGVHITAFLHDRSLYPGDLFHFHRARIILAARTHGLWALDAPWPMVNDHATLTTDTRWGAMMGFDGKLALVPEQVPVIHAAYRPTPEELARARSIVAAMEQLQAAGEGSGVESGNFLDPVVLAPALATIARAEAPA